MTKWLMAKILKKASKVLAKLYKKCVPDVSKCY